VNATSIRVPVFFGDGLAVHVETREPLALGRARALLEQGTGLVLDDLPTPRDAVERPDAVVACGGTARTPEVSISGSPPITSAEARPPILWTSSKFWCASISRLYFVK
jgi:hypothetical protein